MNDKNLLPEKELAGLLEHEAEKVDANLDLWPAIERQLKMAQTATQPMPESDLPLLDPETTTAEPKPIFTLPRVVKFALGIAAVLALAFIVTVTFLPGNNSSIIEGSQKATVSPVNNPTVPAATPTPHVVTGTLKATLTGHTQGVANLAWNADGTQLASSSDDKTVKTWSLNGQLLSSSYFTSETLPQLPFPHEVTRTTLFGNKITEVFAPNGKLKAVRVSSTEYNLQQADGKIIAKLTIPDGAIFQLAWSPDSQTIVASGQAVKQAGPGDIRVWFWKTDGTLIATLSQFYYPINSMAWSPDSQRLAITAKGQNQAGLWSAEGKLITTLPGDFVIWELAWSPDGQTLAAACSDNLVRLYGQTGNLVEPFNLVATLTGHQEQVGTVAWSPDGKTLASGSEDKTIKLWTIK